MASWIDVTRTRFMDCPSCIAPHYMRFLFGDRLIHGQSLPCSSHVASWARAHSDLRLCLSSSMYLRNTKPTGMRVTNTEDFVKFNTMGSQFADDVMFLSLA